MDVETPKNDNLEEEIKQLKNMINKILQNQTNELNILKEELEKYKIENKKLKEELFEIQKIISYNQINNNKLKDQIINLKYQLNLKDIEIKNLKNNINKIEEPKYSINDIIVVTFSSKDINYEIKCLTNDIFAEVEEKLYKKYDNLRETNNKFIINGKPILRFKKMKENNIKDGDTIQLIKLE